MSVKLKSLHEQVMVITGASSGIGLATAKMAARQGAKVVLAARCDESLAEVEKQIIANGGQAVHVAADVTKREDIEHIISVARDRFGGFDTWVNNAGVSIFGRLDQISEQDHRQLFEVNFWGLVNGSLLALETLRTRGGALINLGSEVSDLAIPMQGMYCASKHAIKGFTDALRLEIEAEKLPVSITLIKPAGINTPYPQHARNYMDEEPTLPPPVYAPEEVANAICHAAQHPVRDVYVGGGSKLMSSLNKHAPRLVDWVTERGMISQQKSGKPPRNPMGALYQAGGGARAHGDYEGHVMQRSLYTRASLHPWLTTAIIGAVGVGLAIGTSLLAESVRPECDRRSRRWI